MPETDFRFSVQATALAGKHALAAAVGLALTALAAEAQEAGDAIETIVVEGNASGRYLGSERFTAPLIDTPKAIAIVSSELIEQRGATSLIEALKSVPGVTFNAGEGGQPAGDNLRIRGFDAGADVFVDGIRDSGSQTRDIFALEQVEVVKGPGSAYTGRGSTGGSVNLVSKRPTAQSFVTTSLAAGTDSVGRATVDANLPFGDSAAFRINALTHSGEIAGRDQVAFDHSGLATALAFGIESRTRVDLSHYHYRTDDVPDYSIPYSRNADNSANEGPPAAVDRDNFYGLLNRDFQKTGSDIVSMTVEHALSDRLSLRNTTRIGRSSNDYIVTNPDDSRANVANGFVLRNTKSRNSETDTKANVLDLIGRFESDRLTHDFMAGVEISSERMQNRNYAVEILYSANANTDFENSCSFPGVIGAASNYNCTTLDAPNPNDPWSGTISPSPNATHVETETRSLYAFDTIGFNDTWSLNLGLRYDDYETVQNAGAIEAPIRLANQSDFWNYQLGLVHKPASNGSVYLATGSSSNPSGNTLGDGSENLSAGNDDLEPERSRTYELGTKWALAEGRLFLDAALFHTVKENARVAIEPGRGAPEQTIGREAIDGFEIGLTGSVTDTLDVLFAYTWLDSEIGDDGPVADNDGNRFPNTPRGSASLWATYSPTARMTLGGGATYVGLRYGDPANTVWAPAYVTYDAMAAIDLNERISLRLNLQNLTNETYFVRPYRSHYAAIGPGRAALFSVTFGL